MLSEKGSPSEAGQTLIELVVVVGVLVIVVGALTFATIASIRNAQFSKNQAQATKLAQEGIERVRTLRDRDRADSISYNDGSLTAGKFSDLWLITLRCPANCYFYFNPSGVLISATSSNAELISSGTFKRQFQIEDYASDQKKVTSVVTWIDFSGSHESRLTTILRRR